VDDFEHDIHQRRYIFDERGYLSAIRYYDELGQPLMDRSWNEIGAHDLP
jgi:hypothetical protein